MRKATVSKCALNFETLEQKTLLAGDVGVAIVDGAVVVSGDEAANHVEIVTNVEAEQIVVRGLPDAEGVETTLNGQTGPVRIEGLARNILVRMGMGNDAVNIPRGRFGNVNVATGRGADLVRVGNLDPTDPPTTEATGEAIPAAAFASLDIATGRGSDTILQDNVVVANDMRLATGPGTDTVRLGIGPTSSTATANLSIGGNLAVGTGLGDDLVTSRAMQVAGNTAISTGRGADGVMLAGMRGPGRTAIHTGQGADQVSVVGGQAALLAIDTGAGNDQAAVVDSAFADLRVSMGAGNDTIAVGETSVANRAIVFGGEGRDRFVRLGGNQADQFAIVAFERIVNGQPDESETA